MTTFLKETKEKNLSILISTSVTNIFIKIRKLG